MVLFRFRKKTLKINHLLNIKIQLGVIGKLNLKTFKTQNGIHKKIVKDKNKSA